MVSGVSVQPSRRPKKRPVKSKKETDERRTLNIERSTSNNVFCLFKIAEQYHLASLTTKAKSEFTF